jgi:hypothetical protein
MTQDEVLATLHRVVQENKHYTTWTVSTPHLVALVREVIEQEREAIAQMLEDAPPLVDFAKNDQGGCLMCGFTPKLAAQTIRTRGQA